MVNQPLMLAVFLALGVGAVVAFAEWLHGRRIRRVAHLAFGIGGAPRAWTRIAPLVRTVAAALVVFGLVVLALQKPEAVERIPTKEASKHLLICLDASPSMYVDDAGPRGDQKRAIWAGRVLKGILDRIDTETTRVSVFAIYTDALPIVQDTFDLNVVEHLFDGLPYHTAFEPGATLLSSGIAKALDYARHWPRDSATLVVISDGDSEDGAGVRFVPASIADAIVIGVGDPSRPTMVAGHRSKQDVASLRTLAHALDGFYHQGNTQQLPSSVLDKLTMIQPRITDSIGLRELAFLAIAVGSVLLAGIGPALALLGKRASQLTVRPRAVARRETLTPEVMT